jgi:hypothetical protein
MRVKYTNISLTSRTTVFQERLDCSFGLAYEVFTADLEMGVNLAFYNGVFMGITSLDINNNIGHSA